jgi:hypothetical protein
MQGRSLLVVQQRNAGANPDRAGLVDGVPGGELKSPSGLNPTRRMLVETGVETPVVVQGAKALGQVSKGGHALWRIFVVHT